MNNDESANQATQDMLIVDHRLTELFSAEKLDLFGMPSLIVFQIPKVFIRQWPFPRIGKHFSPGADSVMSGRWTKQA